MTTHDMTSEAWTKLVELDTNEREAELVRHYSELAGVPEEERITQIARNAEVFYDLSNDTLRVLTVARLRAWLAMEPEKAQIIASSYNAAMLRLSGNKAMRRVALVQTLVREFSHEEQERLVVLVPGVFGGVPTAAARAAQTQSRPAEEPAAPKKRGWWPFGGR